MTATIPDHLPLRAYMSALGSTADEVAESLSALGITGERACVEHCIIAVYLQMMLPRGRFWVSETCITDVRIESESYGTWDVTPPVAEFINRFDANRYPDLVSGFVWPPGFHHVLEWS